jgi:hypothetical protein
VATQLGEATWAPLWYLLLSLGAVACIGPLGRIGGNLVNLFVPA